MLETSLNAADSATSYDAAQVTIHRVRIASRNDGHFAPTPTPRVGWTVETALPDWWQRCAELVLDDGPPVVLETDQSTGIEWPFLPLDAYRSHSLKVRVTGVDGSLSAWSDAVTVQPTFLHVGDWEAQTIRAADPPSPAAPALLRRDFKVVRPVRQALLFAAAQGVYQVAVNGADVDDAVLKPGWTAYRARTLHECTDVTHLLDPVSGENQLLVRLAGGWWTEEYGFSGAGRRVYGDQPSLALQLRIEYDDGTVETIISDERWMATTSTPIVSSSLYHGERIDARRRTSQAGRSGWSPVALSDHSIVPEPMIAEPVRRVAELPVKELIRTPSGALVLDFGQNLVGRLRLRASGEAGRVITVRHAEVLEHGELGTRPLRLARATDEFVVSGDGEDLFEPEFTFHGFRYAQIDGWPGELDIAAVTAVVLSSDMRRTGWFSSSDPRIDRLHENVVWGMRGNFLSVPTDCPQRDERLGWTGDIQVFSPTAAYLYDCEGFLASWLRDVRLEQQVLGGICPIVVPSVLDDGHKPVAAWGDAASVVPTVLYQRFGDLQMLTEQYEAMRMWVEAELAAADEQLLWRGMFQFGDWLDPAAPPDNAAAARTDPDLVATAYLIRSLDLIASAADRLGKTDDESRYRGLADRARAAFREAFVDNDARLRSDAPTAYALALQFDLVTEPRLREQFGERLAALTEAEGHHIATGFVGTPLILDALISAGRPDTAAALLLQTENPSWLYPVTMGATTVWERWDSMLPDGSINPGEMTSFNHYALGAVADWLHRSLAGLAPLAPGYRRFAVDPIFLDHFQRVETAHETPYGPASVAWARRDGMIEMRVTVPPNSRAELRFGGDTEIVGSGVHQRRIPDAPLHTATRVSAESLNRE